MRAWVAARRYRRSLANIFDLYMPLAHQIQFMDNTDGKLSPIATVKARPSGALVTIKDAAKWEELQRQASRARKSPRGE